MKVFMRIFLKKLKISLQHLLVNLFQTFLAVFSVILIFAWRKYNKIIVLLVFGYLKRSYEKKIRIQQTSLYIMTIKNIISNTFSMWFPIQIRCSQPTVKSQILTTTENE